MPRVPFEMLPDEGRIWVFGVSAALSADSTASLLREVDDYLDGWSAHGAPLTCARDWRDGRFLAIGVDQSTAGASGCSIDALFRILQGTERSLGVALVAGGRVFHRDAAGRCSAWTGRPMRRACAMVRLAPTRRSSTRR